MTITNFYVASVSEEGSVHRPLNGGTEREMYLSYRARRCERLGSAQDRDGSLKVEESLWSDIRTRLQTLIECSRALEIDTEDGVQQMNKSCKARGVG